MTWTLTHAGEVMDLLAPRPEAVMLNDIAVHLSRIARFSGATETFYSVADHSVFVAQIIKDLGGDLRAQRAGLFHDAHEAYIGDIPTPVKTALGKQAGEAVELLKHRLDVAIFEALDVVVDRDTALLIKHADAIALATERERFMPACGPDWPLKALPTTREIHVSKTMEHATFDFIKLNWTLKSALAGAPDLIQQVGAAHEHF